MGWREQMVTVPVEDEGLTLEGVWQAGKERAAVIAPAHPIYGGSLEHPVVNEIAYALYREGFASLRFNWRGVGASQGVMSGDPGAAERDYRAALEHVACTVPGPLTACGYSFGAAAALRVGLGDERVRSLLLVAPPIDLIVDQPLEALERPLHVIVGSHDAFAPVTALSELLEPLPCARLDVIPKADHFFAGGGLADLDELIRAAVS
ncbi:MAG: alpha/beta hydrolase [Myxococcota bacterium]